VERTRVALQARDIRVFVVIMRRGRGDEREFDDRIANMRRRANLDNRYVYVASGE